MKFLEKNFWILEALDNHNITTQRQLAELSGISLGRVNYVLKSLLKEGLIKIRNFQKNPRKVCYTYYLTPKGLEAKSIMAAKFIMAKLREYKSLRQRVAERLEVVEKKGHFRIIFVGPSIVKEFVDSIVKENRLELALVGHCNDWEDLKFHEPGSFDIVLLFDSHMEVIRKIKEATGISMEKILSLW